MFLPNRMSKVNILLYGKYLSRVTEALGSSGMVHLIDAKAESARNLLVGVNTEADVAAIEKELSRCESLMGSLDLEADERAGATEAQEKTLALEEISELLDGVEKRYRECSAAGSKILSEQNIIKNSEEALEKLPFQNLNISALENLRQLQVFAGNFQDVDTLLRARKTLEGEALVIREPKDGLDVLVLTTHGHQASVDDVLGKFQFRKFDLSKNSTPDEGSIEVRLESLNAKLAALQKELSDVQKKIASLGIEFGMVLPAVRRQLRILLTTRKAQGYFGQARQLFCVSGWIPAEAIGELQNIVSQATHGTAVIKIKAAEEEGKQDVPVQLSSSWLTRPFRMLVTNFGMPNYHELDPSFFVGLSFIVMFGYMFGDLGQGLVLLLAGLFMKFSRRVGESLRDTGTMLCCCGASAMFFGILYGSVFGYEELFHALWVSPLHTRDIPQLLLTAIGIGAVFLSVSLLINIINHFRNRRYFEGTFDKYGVLGLVFYWACLLTAVMVVFTRKFHTWQLVLILLPLALLMFRLPIRIVVMKIRKRMKKSSPGNAAEEEDESDGFIGMMLEGVIETMETLTGYLSGTVSFVRVGAFAISHAALCMAVYTIMGLVGNVPGAGLLKLAVALLGNLFIIGFEGMVAAIQCVRLEYYEMFGRYFQGGGTPYRPFEVNDSEKNLNTK